MIVPLKKFLFVFINNLSLFFLLMIGIQNSSSKHEVNLIANKTASLPISFIIGVSFISGSITGNFLKINLNNKN